MPAEERLFLDHRIAVRQRPVQPPPVHERPPSVSSRPPDVIPVRRPLRSLPVEQRLPAAVRLNEQRMIELRATVNYPVVHVHSGKKIARGSRRGNSKAMGCIVRSFEKIDLAAARIPRPPPELEDTNPQSAYPGSFSQTSAGRRNRSSSLSKSPCEGTNDASNSPTACTASFGRAGRLCGANSPALFARDTSAGKSASIESKNPACSDRSRTARNPRPIERARGPAAPWPPPGRARDSSHTQRSAAHPAEAAQKSASPRHAVQEGRNSTWRHHITSHPRSFDARNDANPRDEGPRRRWKCDPPRQSSQSLSPPLGASLEGACGRVLLSELS